MVPDPGDHGQEVGARPHQGRAVGHGDAANGDARQFHDLAPPFEDLEIGPCLGLLGAGREEGAEGHVVGAGLGRLDGQVARIVTGHADDGALAHRPPGAGIIAVLLSLSTDG